MRRILYLSRGGLTAGSQRQLSHLLAGLDSRRYEPIVVCREDGPFVESLKADGVRTHVLTLHPWRKWTARLLRFADCRRLGRLARQADPALVHCSDLWLAGYLRHVAGMLGVPSVLHVRAPKSPRELRKHGCHRVSATIAISGRVQGKLLEAGVPAERISVIHDAVDLQQFRPRGEQANVLRREFPQAQGVLIGLVGRITPGKRQADFLHAAQQAIRIGGGQATFFIIGPVHSPQYAACLRSLAEQDGLAGRVVFTGQRADMPEVLASLDALVTLSGGSVMIEAMACGTPVVSAGFTPAGQSMIVRDGQTGLLLPPGREDELPEVLLRVIAEPELRRRFGQAGRRHAETVFGTEALVAATLRLYDWLLDGDGRCEQVPLHGLPAEH